MRARTHSPSSSGEATPVGPVATPGEVRASFALWLAAIAAAVFETVLVVVEVLSGHLALGTGGVIVGVGMRLLIFTLVVYVASRMLRGRNWARFVLAIGLGVFGTLSIVIGPVSWLAEGHTIGEFVAGADPMLLLFASSRVVHLIAVFAALVLMFRPAANDYFRAARSTRRLAPGRTMADRSERK
jgi:hypothetical protein